MENFGLIKSKMDGSEHIFGSVNTQPTTLPESYSYKPFLPNILDQGSNPICVPCSLSAYLNWKENMKDGSTKDNKVDYMEIFNSRQTLSNDGMSFKDALHYLRHDGVVSDVGLMKINSYAMVMSSYMLKAAIVMNGPCVGGLPVYNYNYEFWKKNYGDEFLGYHAISIIGYENGEFLIRNSWGKSFGQKGYCSIKESDLNKFIEIWTILN